MTSEEAKLFAALSRYRDMNGGDPEYLLIGRAELRHMLSATETPHSPFNIYESGHDPGYRLFGIQIQMGNDDHEPPHWRPAPGQGGG
jgi:hypothetical protein